LSDEGLGVEDVSTPLAAVVTVPSGAMTCRVEGVLARRRVVAPPRQAVAAARDLSSKVGHGADTSHSDASGTLPSAIWPPYQKRPWSR